MAGAIAAAVIRRVARERAAQLHGFGRSTPILAWVCALAARFYPGLADHADALVSHLQASEIAQSGRVLDVGCGDGNGIAFLNSLGLHASGVEIDPHAVKAARTRGLDVIQGDIGSAGIADNSFDVVTSGHVLEHVHDARGFLVECRRVLKPGGALVAMTPNARSELLGRHGRNWRGLEPPRHLLLFNADNLAQLASEVGFREIRVKRTAHLASFIHIASTSIAADGRLLGRWAVLRLWLESKVIEARMTREVLHGKSEGAELALIARK